jgi:CxxC motif-containing protein (DUF1111 family)
MRRIPKYLLPAAAAIGLTLAAALAAVPVLNSPDLGGATTRAIDGKTAFTFPAANIKAEHQRDFFFGNRLFNTNWVTAPSSVKSFDGVGPYFNRISCSGCHTQDGRGRPPLAAGEPLNSMLIRLSIPDAASPNGASPHPIYGDQLSEDAILGVAPEGKTKVSYETVAAKYADGEPYELQKPAYEISQLASGPLGDGVMLSPRVAPQVIGLGLLEAVPEEALAALSDPDDADANGVSGRMNRVTDPLTGKIVAGRFGWKANLPNLLAQNAGAAFGDMGLTNPLHESENCAAAQTDCLAAKKAPEIDLSKKFLDKMTLYTRLLAVPSQRSPADPQVVKGGQVFANLGCAGCHAPTLKTGPKAALPELENQTFHPFTDLLLHDLGTALADGRPDIEATGSEWRTPPLWGLGLVEAVNGHDRLLHDGRARGFAEAILWHGGEAEKSKEAFRNAEKAERDALMAFLKSL